MPDLTALPWPPAILAGAIAAGVSTLGLIAAVFTGAWARKRMGLFAAFAAGALVTVSVTHLIPMALAGGEGAPYWILAGFAGGFLLNRGVLALSESAGRAALAAGLTPALGIAFHSFLDGVAYAVTFTVDIAAGALTALGLILHELPEAVIVFSLLAGAGFSTRAAFLIAFVAAALTTPLGAVVAQHSLGALEGPALNTLFAVAAGLLLYIGAAHLLPHVERERSWLAAPAALAGALTALFAETTHSHDHHGPVGHTHAVGASDHGHDGAAHGPPHPNYGRADDDHHHHDHDHDAHAHGDDDGRDR